VHGLERRWGVAVAALVGIVLVSVLTVRYGLPALSGWAASTLPPQADRLIGARTLEVLDRVALQPSGLDAQRQASLQNLFARMTAKLEDGHDYRLELRGGRRLGPNALALPSGIVVMTDELVAIAKHDEEIAAVLAHEIGHVRGRHALRQLIQGAGISILALVVLGDVSSVTALASAAPVLLQARNSRDFEREADEFARRWLRSAGIPAQRFDDILCRMTRTARGKGVDPPVFLSTHPATVERAHCQPDAAAGGLARRHWT
jgi:predicted Zn-dependent protease